MISAVFSMSLLDSTEQRVAMGLLCNNHVNNVQIGTVRFVLLHYCKMKLFGIGLLLICWLSCGIITDSVLLKLSLLLLECQIFGSIKSLFPLLVIEAIFESKLWTATR